jgi:ribosomal protein S18 acetylase RimI-like enzyme
MNTQIDNPSRPEVETVARPRVRIADVADKETIVSAITLAFAGDPAARWMYPDPRQFQRHFPEFIRAFGGKAIDVGTAHYVNAFHGAALWLSPRVQLDEDPLVALVQRTVAEQQQGAVFAVLEKMGAYHPQEPHWYLPLIGVDPARQSGGLGSALLSNGLRRCDVDGLPAYLEATSLRSIPLYEKFGFEALGRIQVETSPPIVPMLRRPRSTGAFA